MCCGLRPVTPIELVVHAPGAPGLRLIGLGPGLRPSRGLKKLQRLFDRHAFWARGRSFTQLGACSPAAMLWLACGEANVS